MKEMIDTIAVKEGKLNQIERAFVNYYLALTEILSEHLSKRDVHTDFTLVEDRFIINYKREQKECG
jgi:hypothetical protein